jgi:hypothetical protein
MRHRNQVDEWDRWHQRPFRAATYVAVTIIVVLALGLIAAAATSSPDPTPEASVYDRVGPTPLNVGIGTTETGDGVFV